MAIQYANGTYSYVVDNFVDLPSGVPPGQLAYVVNTAKAYYSTNGTWKEVGLGVTGGYQPYEYSFDNPPTSPSAYDDEFESGALDVAWTVTSVGTTNPCVSGAVNPTSSLTTPIYDLTTWPSYLLFQSDNSSTQYVDIDRSISIDTNATFFIKLAVPNTISSTATEGNVFFQLKNSGDSNEGVGIGFSNSAGSGLVPRVFVTNNGATTNSDLAQVNEGIPVGNGYLAMWKVGNVYYGGFIGKDGNTITGPSVTKTGVTTFDTAGFRFRTINETPSRTFGLDFFRYYPSVTYALMN